jgi:hypothetical protein
MNAPTLYGRRQHDFDIPQCIVELARHCPADQLTPQKFAAIVNALLLRAAEFDREGWYGMDSVEAGLLEAANCLDDVRGPGHEKRAAEEEQHQRELRQWAFERSL